MDHLVGILQGHGETGWIEKGPRNWQQEHRRGPRRRLRPLGNNRFLQAGGSIPARRIGRWQSGGSRGTVGLFGNMATSDLGDGMTKEIYDPTSVVNHKVAIAFDSNE